MKTSSFFLYDGAGRISIARYAPKHVSGHVQYSALAPGKWFKNAENKTYERYRDLYYQEILAPLNAYVVWDELHRLAGDAEPVLLCWEHLRKEGDWCHRRIVAEWFEDRVGAIVAEMVIAPTPRKIKTDPRQATLFD